jgi:hypothetical protein
MRRKLIITASVLLLPSIGFVFFQFRPVPPRGNFPPNFSEIEKREILSVARHDAVRQVLKNLRHADFREAWRWIANSRKQTVRSVGEQRDGQIWVTFAFDEPGATDGYAIWARYMMTNHHGHWVITQLF